MQRAIRQGRSKGTAHTRKYRRRRRKRRIENRYFVELFKYVCQVEYLSGYFMLRNAQIINEEYDGTPPKQVKAYVTSGGYYLIHFDSLNRLVIAFNDTFFFPFDKSIGHASIRYAVLCGTMLCYSRINIHFDSNLN